MAGGLGTAKYLGWHVCLPMFILAVQNVVLGWIMY